jgi:hypothetical protein
MVVIRLIARLKILSNSSKSLLTNAARPRKSVLLKYDMRMNFEFFKVYFLGRYIDIQTKICFYFDKNK